MQKNVSFDLFCYFGGFFSNPLQTTEGLLSFSEIALCVPLFMRAKWTAGELISLFRLTGVHVFG